MSDKQYDRLPPHFSFAQLRPGSAGESDLFRQIAALRYEVYCLERGFLDPDDYPRKVEVDDYDDRSMHAAAFDPDGLLVGAVRLVLATGSQGFPFEKYCGVFENFVFPPCEQCGEVSRLVVRKSFRRRPGDSPPGVSKKDLEQARRGAISRKTPGPGGGRRSDSPEILLGLYREIFHFSRRNGIRYWFSAMERALLRSMARIGFKFNPVGPGTDYYGPVTPFMSDLSEFKATMRNHDLRL